MEGKFREMSLVRIAAEKKVCAVQVGHRCFTMLSADAALEDEDCPLHEVKQTNYTVIVRQTQKAVMHIE